MDSELKQLLEQNLELARENNTMLLAMKRRAQWGLIGQVVFWVLFVIAPLIFLWGYLGPLMSAVNGNFDGSGMNMNDLQNLLQQYQNQ